MSQLQRYPKRRKSDWCRVNANHLSHRSTAARVVNDALRQTYHEAMALNILQRQESAILPAAVNKNQNGLNHNGYGVLPL